MDLQPSRWTCTGSPTGGSGPGRSDGFRRWGKSLLILPSIYPKQSGTRTISTILGRARRIIRARPLLDAMSGRESGGNPFSSPRGEGAIIRVSASSRQVDAPSAGARVCRSPPHTTGPWACDRSRQSREAGYARPARRKNRCSPGIGFTLRAGAQTKRAEPGQARLRRKWPCEDQ